MYNFVFFSDSRFNLYLTKSDLLSQNYIEFQILSFEAIFSWNVRNAGLVPSSIKAVNNYEIYIPF
jgi:hypothetical protein